MKKIATLAIFATALICFSNCHSSKKATKTAPKVTYEANIRPLIETNCSPCHFPDKNGMKKPLNSYTAVKDNIDSMLSRIQRNPADKGFMPFKHPKLSDSTITVFKQWKADGTLEN